MVDIEITPIMVDVPTTITITAIITVTIDSSRVVLQLVSSVVPLDLQFPILSSGSCSSSVCILILLFSFYLKITESRLFSQPVFRFQYTNLRFLFCKKINVCLSIVIQSVLRPAYSFLLQIFYNALVVFSERGVP